MDNSDTIAFARWAQMNWDQFADALTFGLSGYSDFAASSWPINCARGHWQTDMLNPSAWSGTMFWTAAIDYSHQEACSHINTPLPKW